MAVYLKQRTYFGSPDFIAFPNDDKTFDYISGNIHRQGSIGVTRYFMLMDLAREDGFQIALYSRKTDTWTKWKGFYAGWDHYELQHAYDVHRSVLKNEIVIESDCLCDSCQATKDINKQLAEPDRLPMKKACLDCYTSNYEATRIMGAIIESHGMRPSYYYSGSKSIHCHVYLNLQCFYSIDAFLLKKIKERFHFPGTFLRKFMEWFRELLITCWGTKVREFDRQLIKSSHLIRAELSKNKIGYKTFLGHKYEDISFIPNVCNEDNNILPVLGERLLSTPDSPQELVEEFLQSLEKKERTATQHRKEMSLLAWIDPEAQHQVMGCVQFLLSDEFRSAGDGYQRAMFIIANELKQKVGPEQAIGQLRDWVARMGCPINDLEIEYRCFRAKEYTYTHDAVHRFLEELGVQQPLAKCQSYNKKQVLLVVPQAI